MSYRNVPYCFLAVINFNYTELNYMTQVLRLNAPGYFPILKPQLRMRDIMIGIMVHSFKCGFGIVGITFRLKQFEHLWSAFSSDLHYFFAKVHQFFNTICCSILYPYLLSLYGLRDQIDFQTIMRPWQLSKKSVPCRYWQSDP